MDYIRIFLQLLFVINKEPSPDTFAFLTMISWLGFMSYLRRFKALRIFIQLLVACITASSMFLVVLTIMLIAFTNTFYVKAMLTAEAVDPLVIHTHLAIFIESMKLQYRGMFGDFEPDDYDKQTNWPFFIVGSFLTTIVMMNLLIAIIGDEFEKVMTSIVP